MKTIDFYGHKSGGFLPTMIRLRTNSDIHHVSVGLGENMFESTAAGNGVSVSYDKKDNITIVLSIETTEEKYKECMAFGNNSVGTIEYDFLGTVALFFGVAYHNKKKQYCNEFAMEMLKILGYECKISENLLSPKELMYLVKGIAEEQKRNKGINNG